MIQLTDEQKKLAKTFGWRIDLNSFPKSTRQVTRAFIIMGIHCGPWPVKWGGFYSICYPDKRMIDTGLKALYLWSLEEWCEFAIKNQ